MSVHTTNKQKSLICQLQKVSSVRCVVLEICSEHSQDSMTSGMYLCDVGNQFNKKIFKNWGTVNCSMKIYFILGKRALYCKVPLVQSTFMLAAVIGIFYIKWLFFTQSSGKHQYRHGQTLNSYHYRFIFIFKKLPLK